MPDRGTIVLTEDGDPCRSRKLLQRGRRWRRWRTHIREHFGPFSNVFPRAGLPGHPCGTSASFRLRRNGDYCTLVTMGMGARKMAVPEETGGIPSGAGGGGCRPAVGTGGWDAEAMEDERWYWPVRLLKVLARLPIENDTWLGLGPHPGQGSPPFAENYGPVRRHPDLSPGRGGRGGGLHPAGRRRGQFLPGDPPLSGRAGLQAAPQRRGNCWCGWRDVSFIVDPDRPQRHGGRRSGRGRGTAAGFWTTGRGTWKASGKRSSRWTSCAPITTWPSISAGAWSGT